MEAENGDLKATLPYVGMKTPTLYKFITSS